MFYLIFFLGYATRCSYRLYTIKVNDIDTTLSNTSITYKLWIFEFYVNKEIKNVSLYACILKIAISHLYLVFAVIKITIININLNNKEYIYEKLKINIFY